MIGEPRQAPGGAKMSLGQIERELGKLRTNDDGTLALRSSVLNLIVVTDEEPARSPPRSRSWRAAIQRGPGVIADPEGEPNVDVGLGLLSR